MQKCHNISVLANLQDLSSFLIFFNAYLSYYICLFGQNRKVLSISDAELLQSYS